MRFTRRLTLLALLVLALVFLVATAAFATSAQVDTTETPTVITVTGTAATSGASNTGAPVGDYVASSPSVILTFGTTVPVQLNCSSRSTLTIEAAGNGTIGELWFESCTSGINPCTINDGDTSSNTTTPVTIGNGRFTVTGRTETDTTQATFRLDTGTGLTVADISFTMTCSAIGLECRFTTPTGNNSGTYRFDATVEEGTPATLSFTNSTFDGDTQTCANLDMTATYMLDDPTTGNTGATQPVITDPDDITVSP